MKTIVSKASEAWLPCKQRDTQKAPRICSPATKVEHNREEHESLTWKLQTPNLSVGSY